MKPHVLVFALVGVPLFLGACTSLSTTPVENLKDGNPDTVKGLVYYLPIGRIHAVGNVAKDTSNPPSTPAPGAATPVPTQGSGTGTTSPFTITITADITADDKCGYYVKRDSNYIYDDTIDIKIDGTTGLLSSGNATSTDETAEIVSDLAQMVTKTLSLNPPNLTPETYPKPFDITFYPNGVTPPTGGLSYADAVTKLEQCGFELHAPPMSDSIPSGKPHEEPSLPSDYHDGIAFRLPLAYPVSITSTSDVKTMRIAASKNLLLPDTGKTYFLDFSRMPFVAKKTNLSFTNGMLTEFSQAVPSPIAGFIGIPKAIIQAIVPLPLGSSAPSSNSAGAEKSTTASK